MSGLDLYLSQRTLALLFVYGALIGFGLGLLYDGLRVARLALGESPDETRGRPPLLTVFLFFEDVFFLLAATLSLILLCYYGNDGQIRAPAALGLLGGFFVYRHTVSRLVLRLANGLIRLAKKLLSALCGLLTAPLRGLWSVTVGRWLNLRRERITEKRIHELTEKAARGFDLPEKTGNHARKTE